MFKPNRPDPSWRQWNVVTRKRGEVLSGKSGSAGAGMERRQAACALAAAKSMTGFAAPRRKRHRSIAGVVRDGILTMDEKRFLSRRPMPRVAFPSLPRIFPAMMAGR